MVCFSHQLYQSQNGNFIMDLPKTMYDHNAIFYIVDHLSTQAHFVFTKMMAIVKEIAQLFIREIYRLHGSKQHITSQCVYFVARTIVLFGVLFLKKHVFIKRIFSMKCFETFYIFYLQLPQYVICFFTIKFGESFFFENTQILLDFLFCLENL